MLSSKEDLRYYLKCDKIALKIPDRIKRPRPFVDHIWKYEILLRKTEYYTNRTHSKIGRIISLFYKTRLQLFGEKLGISIYVNCFGPGLSIAHHGCIVVNGNARIGNNCRIHEGVTIGTTNGSSKAPVIGNNCFLGSGCKVIGEITIADNIAIGAGAVVVKDIMQDNVSVAGVPAKIISSKGSDQNVVDATNIVNKQETILKKKRRSSFSYRAH